MYIPPGKTEAEVLDAIERCVNQLAPKFVFGHYDLEDIKQHGRMKAIEMLNNRKYDESRPLENFLYTVIKTRYYNLQRDKLRRSDAPCKKCHGGEPCTPGCCDKYLAWKKRNASKANLARPVGIDGVSGEEECGAKSSPTLEQDVDISEMMRRIDLQLSVELRFLWKQLQDGVKIPQVKRELVESAVRDILGLQSQSEDEEDDE